MADDRRIKNYSLGSQGVILDPHHLLPGVSPEGLSLAQNATHDPKAGFGGAIRKRPGFARFNNAYAGGIILGGIAMPVAGFGGAPSSGGGAIIGTGDVSDGTSVGTGDMTGSAGSTFDGGDIATTPGGAGLFNGGSSIFSGKRLMIVGRLGSDATVSNEGGSGWYVSSKGLADVAVKVIPPGPPTVPYSFPATATFADAWGSNPYCIKDNTPAGLYYGGAYGNQVTGITFGAVRTVGVGPMGLGIRRTTGATDTLVATIPPNTHGLDANADDPSGRGITAITINSGGAGYTVGDLLTLTGGTFSVAAQVTVATVGASNAVATVTQTRKGIYTVMPTSGTLTGGTGTGATYNGISVTSSQRSAITSMHDSPDGNIYLAVKDKYAGQDNALSLGRAYKLVPSSGALTELNLSTTSGSPAAFLRLPYAVQWFDGHTYVGTFPDAVDETASVYATDGDVATVYTSFTLGSGYAALISCFATYNGRLWMGTGCWATAAGFSRVWSRQPGTPADPLASPWASMKTAAGGTAQNGNYIVSLVEFGDALYASFFNPGQAAQIYKIVADDPGDPLSVNYTITTVATNAVEIGNYPYYLFVDQDVLYAIGVNDAGPTTSAYVTTDGATWTNKSTSLPTLSSSSRMRPIFFGVNQ